MVSGTYCGSCHGQRSRVCIPLSCVCLSLATVPERAWPWRGQRPSDAVPELIRSSQRHYLIDALNRAWIARPPVAPWDPRVHPNRRIERMGRLGARFTGVMRLTAWAHSMLAGLAGDVREVLSATRQHVGVRASAYFWVRSVTSLDAYPPGRDGLQGRVKQSQQRRVLCRVQGPGHCPQTRSEWEPMSVAS
jgi:hypothetical protein